jgi:hypothetical protein
MVGPGGSFRRATKASSAFVSAGTCAMSRASLVGLSLFFALVAAFGLFRAVREYPSQWGRVLAQPGAASSESPQIDLARTLRAAGDSDGPRYGAKVQLAEFVQSNGRRITVVLVEGTFNARTIEPRQAWHDLGSSMLLISSADENRSAKGGLSGPIASGCGVEKATVQQQLGTASIVPCKGPYADGGHIKWVGTLSTIVEAPQDAVCPSGEMLCGTTRARPV